MSEREKLKKSAEEATSGEWVVREYPGGHIGVDVKNAKPDWKTDIFHPRVGSDGYGGGGSSREDAEYIAAANPSTILALLAELEQAERERGEIIKLMHLEQYRGGFLLPAEPGPADCKSLPDAVSELLKLGDNEHKKLEASEAALRTLRQAALRQADMRQMSPAEYAKKYGISLSLEKYCAEEDSNVKALRLAAEGGK